MAWRDSHPPCDKCKIGQRGDIDQCAKCFVELLPDNEEAVFIFSIVRNQWVTAGSDNLPVSINLNAVVAMMDLYAIKNKKRCLSLVTTVSSKIVEQIQQKAKAERDRQKSIRRR